MDSDVKKYLNAIESLERKIAELEEKLAEYEIVQQFEDENGIVIAETPTVKEWSEIELDDLVQLHWFHHEHR